MTKQQILDGLTEAINETLTQVTMNEELTESQNTSLTDVLAGVLENVNPNHNYPPVPKA